MRTERLELSRVTPLEPKSSASTSSATFANKTKLPFLLHIAFAIKLIYVKNPEDGKKMPVTPHLSRRNGVI